MSRAVPADDTLSLTAGQLDEASIPDAIVNSWACLLPVTGGSSCDVGMITFMLTLHCLLQEMSGKLVP